jgi:hypothetical protein
VGGLGNNLKPEKRLWGEEWWCSLTIETCNLLEQDANGIHVTTALNNETVQMIWQP